MSIAFSPNGARLASTCSDGTLHLWNAPTESESKAIALAVGAASRAAPVRLGSPDLLCRGAENDIAAAFARLGFTEDLFHEGVYLIDLLGDQVEAAARLQTLLTAFNEQTGDRELGVVRRIGQDDVERA